jgi:translation initiation factor 1 (eIF-1/SUI1)
MCRQDQCACKHKIIANSKRQTMKKIIPINFFALLMTMVFATIVHGQQRPSQRPFVSVMNQVKQKQIERQKMLQQMKQATPSNNASQNGSIQLQPGTGSSTQPGAAQQRAQSAPKTNEQPVTNKQQVKVSKQ